MSNPNDVSAVNEIVETKVTRKSSNTRACSLFITPDLSLIYKGKCTVKIECNFTNKS